MDIDAGNPSSGNKSTVKKPEIIVDHTFDESAVYSGKVKNFRPSFRVRITPDQDLSSLGVKNSVVECSVSDVHTHQTNVQLAKDQAVEFRLRKDNFGVYAIFLSGPGGAHIHGDAAPEHKRPSHTEVNNGQRYNGTVKMFVWAQGFGYVTLDNKDSIQLPEIKNEKAKKRFEKNGEIWFHRSDIKSTDAAVGCGRGEACTFSLYIDEKGIGAHNITRPNGQPFSGCRTDVHRGPKHKKKKKKKQSQNPMQAQIEKALRNMGFGPMRGKKTPMLMPMGGMGGMMSMPMMMGGSPYMMMMPGMGKKKRKRNKKKKNKSGN